MRWLQGLFGKGEVHPAEEKGLDSSCQQGKAAECTQILRPAAGIYGEK